MTTKFVGPDGKSRCQWCGAAPEFLDYHDKEWEFPLERRTLIMVFIIPLGVWLTIPKRLAGSKRFASYELRTMQRHVEENRELFLEAWNEHLSN